MRFADLRERFDKIEFPAQGEPSHPERESVLMARSTIQSAVIDDEFLADCIEFELQLIVGTEFRRGLVPFHTIQESGIRFAFGYWPPGGTPGPHEHTAWTITAVCRNELEVHTYDRAESYRRGELVPKNHFPAAAGRVGYIYDPSIHAPINTSCDWSLSLHITSPRDGEPIEACEPPLGMTQRQRPLPPPTHPYATAAAARIRSQGVHVLARTLADMKIARASRLLEKCAELGSHSTRKLVADALNVGEGRRAPYRLQRTHPDLLLSHRVNDDRVTLFSEVHGGLFEELTVDTIAAEAIAYITREQVFDALDLPGSLTDEERTQIAETLEDSGLFTKAA
jgi:hypothetical protein